MVPKRCPLISLLLVSLFAATLANADVHAVYLGSFGSKGPDLGQLSGPDGIAISDDGFVYVADTYASRVQKFTVTGDFVAAFGSQGTGPGQFQLPYGIDVDAEGNVYVGDIGRNVVQKFAADGSYLLTFETPENFHPFGLWAADGGLVYVTDRPCGKVRKFSASGVLEGDIGPGLGSVTLSFPQNIEGDDAGHLYISDGSGALRIVVVTLAGGYVQSFPAPSSGPSQGNPTGGDFIQGRFYLTEYNLDRCIGLSGTDVVDDLASGPEFATPLDCATYGDSLLLVLDTGHGLVRRYRVGDFGNAPTVHVVAPNGGEAYLVGATVSLQWTAVDDGSIASVDLLLSRNNGLSYSTLATGLANTGTYDWVATGPPSPQCRLMLRAHDDQGLTAEDQSDFTWSISSTSAPLRARFLDTFGSCGPGSGQFGGPDGIAVSDDGFLYVADTYNSRVQKFTLGGTFVASFGSNGTGAGQFQRPYGIDVGPDGVVYVGDLDLHRVQKFAADGTYLATFGASSLSQPFGLWVSDDGVVYVTDRPARRIARFSTNGTYLGSWGPSIAGHTFSAPQNIEGDGDNLLVSDGGGTFKVQILTNTGTFVRSMHYDSHGNPTGAAVAKGTLVLSEYNLDHVLGIDLDSDSTVFTLNQATGPAMSSPIDCAVSGDSLLLVLDTGHCRVIRYEILPGSGPKAHVVYPNGGEILSIGATATLQWTASADPAVASVDLSLSRDGGTNFETVATGLANSGSYEWTVSGPASENCLLRVVARDSAGIEAGDLSDGNWRIRMPVGPPELTFLDTFGSTELSGPDGIATTPDGFVYVADTYHGRVVKYTVDGSLVSMFGTVGSDPGQFRTPYGIDVDLAGNLYVSDFTRRDLQKFDPSGNYVATFAGPDVLQEPLGLCVTDEGVVCVTDRAAHLVRRYTTEGESLPAWGPDFEGSSSVFVSPQNIEDGPDGFYVSDGSGANRIHVLDHDGGYVGNFLSVQNGNPTGAAIVGPRLVLTEYNMNLGYLLDLPSGNSIQTLGDGADYSLSSPIDAASLGDSLAFILDTGNNRVVRLRWAGSPPPSARVTYPNGGEQVEVGSQLNLQWLAGDDQGVASVDLLISRDDGASYAPLAVGIANTGQHAWAVTGSPSDRCRFRVVARDNGGLTGSDRSDAAFQITGSTAVKGVVTSFALSTAPNPARDHCRIGFALPRAGRVRITVHDVQGREVARIAEGDFAAGRYERTWAGRDGIVASGIYFVSLDVDGRQTLRRRLIVMR